MKKPLIIIIEDDEINLQTYDLQAERMRSKIDIVLISNIVDAFRWIKNNPEEIDRVSAFVCDYDLSKGFPDITESGDELDDDRYKSDNVVPFVVELLRMRASTGYTFKILANSGTNNEDLIKLGCDNAIEPAKDFNEILLATFDWDELKKILGREIKSRRVLA